MGFWRFHLLLFTLLLISPLYCVAQADPRTNLREFAQVVIDHYQFSFDMNHQLNDQLLAAYLQNEKIQEGFAELKTIPSLTVESATAALARNDEIETVLIEQTKTYLAAHLEVTDQLLDYLNGMRAFRWNSEVKPLTETLFRGFSRRLTRQLYSKPSAEFKPLINLKDDLESPQSVHALQKWFDYALFDELTKSGSLLTALKSWIGFATLNTTQAAAYRAVLTGLLQHLLKDYSHNEEMIHYLIQVGWSGDGALAFYESNEFRTALDELFKLDPGLQGDFANNLYAKLTLTDRLSLTLSLDAPQRADLIKKMVEFAGAEKVAKRSSVEQLIRFSYKKLIISDSRFFSPQTFSRLAQELISLHLLPEFETNEKLRIGMRDILERTLRFSPYLVESEASARIFRELFDTDPTLLDDLYLPYFKDSLINPLSQVVAEANEKIYLRQLKQFKDILNRALAANDAKEDWGGEFIEDLQKKIDRMGADHIFLGLLAREFDDPLSKLNIRNHYKFSIATTIQTHFSEDAINLIETEIKESGFEGTETELKNLAREQATLKIQTALQNPEKAEKFRRYLNALLNGKFNPEEEKSARELLNWCLIHIDLTFVFGSDEKARSYLLGMLHTTAPLAHSYYAFQPLLVKNLNKYSFSDLGEEEKKVLIHDLLSPRSLPFMSTVSEPKFFEREFLAAYFPLYQRVISELSLSDDERAGLLHFWAQEVKAIRANASYTGDRKFEAPLKSLFETANDLVLTEKEIADLGTEFSKEVFAEIEFARYPNLTLQLLKGGNNPLLFSTYALRLAAFETATHFSKHWVFEHMRLHAFWLSKATDTKQLEEIQTSYENLVKVTNQHLATAGIAHHADFDTINEEYAEAMRKACPVFMHAMAPALRGSN